jgi:signal transduction histidine kinase
MSAATNSAAFEEQRLLSAALQRERTARQQAEELLESKSRELYHSSQELLLRIREADERHEESARAHRQLLQAQSQLVHSEKMASIGQLAAGIAHEINNPLAFVTSNLGTLREYAQTLTALIAAHRQALEALSTRAPELAQSLQEQIESICPESEFRILSEDIFATIDESRDGAQRIADIVVGLRNFSRVDDAEMSQLDLNEALEATLRIAWNEIKYKCEVIKDYAPLPPIPCRGGQINQVFLNLLINAAQAIEERGLITITTRVQDGFVTVAVADTGKGIVPELQSRIFDPFFTTKEIGKGTGLGLSISHAIIAKHGGRIQVQSEPGHGACFTLFLPIAAHGAGSAGHSETTA